MSKFLLIFIFTLISLSSDSQIKRHYFFDESLAINDSTSLVVMVRDAQTQFASEIGHRIYEDTNFIKRLKENWYEDYEPGPRPVHKCGHDMYFYELSGTELTYLNQLNSNCGISEVNCTDLSILLESGRPLRIDTLTRIRMRAYKKDLFTEDFIEGYCVGNNHYWQHCRTDKYPLIYYDGYFETTIKIDSSCSLNENAENFIRTFTEDFEDVNWNISREYDQKLFGPNVKKKPLPSEVKIEIYIKRPKFKLFEGFEINPISFNIEQGTELILMYKN